MVVAKPGAAFGTFLVQVVFGIYLFVACRASDYSHNVILLLFLRKNNPAPVHMPLPVAEVRVSLGPSGTENEICAGISMDEYLEVQERANISRKEDASLHRRLSR